MILVIEMQGQCSFFFFFAATLQI